MVPSPGKLGSKGTAPDFPRYLSPRTRIRFKHPNPFHRARVLAAPPSAAFAQSFGGPFCGGNGRVNISDVTGFPCEVIGLQRRTAIIGSVNQFRSSMMDANSLNPTFPTAGSDFSRRSGALPARTPTAKASSSSVANPSHNARRNHAAPRNDWRNEREIRRAVRALAKFDDQVLRKMGIADRSQIELTVRFCREC